MNIPPDEEPFVTEPGFTHLADPPADAPTSERLPALVLADRARAWLRERRDGRSAVPAPAGGAVLAPAASEAHEETDDDEPVWMRRLTRTILTVSLVVLFWKLHAFKLPSEIAVEKAAAKGKPAPSLNLFKSILDWITPWRWGRGDLLKNTTPTGGDMGAHVFTPDFVRHHLLPKGRLTGWTDSSYAGMPVINFYFPLPTLLIAFLSFLLPYNIAFKLVTVLGIVTLPFAANKAGRLAALRRPVPTLMSLAAVIFVLGRNYDLQIYGGNILATMAGEFSFSISLSAAVLFLGLYTRALRTGEGRGRAAAMLAVTGLCHLLPTLFALTFAFFLFLAHLDPRRIRIKRPDLALAGLAGAFGLAAVVALVNTIPHAVIVFGFVLTVVVLADWFTGIVGLGQLRDAFLILLFGGSIAGFWLIPFKQNLPYTNDMGWEKMTKYTANLFPFWAGKGAKPYADAGIIAVLMIFALAGALTATVSMAVALRRSVERRTVWVSSVMPLAVIAGSVAGLAGSVAKGGVIGLALGLAIVGLTFIVYVALSESTMFWVVAMLVVTTVATTICVVYFRSNTRLTAITAIVAAAFLLVRTALTGEQFHRWPAALTIVLATIATLFRFSPQFRLWNARALPFWFFGIGLLAAFGAAQIPRWIGAAIRHYAEPRRSLPNAPVFGAGAAALATFVAVGLPLNLVPGNVPVPDVKGGRIGVKLAKASTDSNPAPGWAAYNFAGYEARAWNEYKALMDTAKQVGKTNGCGRAMWEYDDARLNSYGTTLALMLLPYWTKGCIGSMEAVYFESSATAPSHWLTAAMVTAPATNNPDGSKKYSGPSNPQRFLRYPQVTLENYPQMFATGIKKLQGAAVRYYISLTDLSQQTADANPDLTKVATSGPFNIYEIKNADRVAPLAEEPVVVTGIDQNQDGGWLDVEQEWFLSEGGYPSTIAWSGPSSWQRTKATIDKPEGVLNYGVGVSLTPTQKKALPKVTVSNISQNNTDIRFHVDKVGVPVLVKTSYFPNWEASGAKGPYRVMPNFMVVIPTRNDVRLHYGYSSADELGFLATFIGLAGVVLLHMRRRIDAVEPLAETGTGEGPTDDDSRADDLRTDDLRSEDLRADDLPEDLPTEDEADAAARSEDRTPEEQHLDGDEPEDLPRHQVKVVDGDVEATADPTEPELRPD